MTIYATELQIRRKPVKLPSDYLDIGDIHKSSAIELKVEEECAVKIYNSRSGIHHKAGSFYFHISFF